MLFYCEGAAQMLEVVYWDKAGLFMLNPCHGCQQYFQLSPLCSTPPISPCPPRLNLPGIRGIMLYHDLKYILPQYLCLKGANRALIF